MKWAIFVISLLSWPKPTTARFENEYVAYEQFGNDRLLDMLRSAHDDTAQQVVDTLKAAVESHRNGAEPNDDLTMMCLRVN